MAASVLCISGCKQSGTESAANGNPQQAPQPAKTVQINGQDVVTLERKATEGGKSPEFLSAQIIPGRGMNLFQITADIPGHGQTNVFFAPSIEEAKAKLTGSDADAFGNASFSFGGAFLVPYPNRIRGKVSADGKTLTTDWHGKTLTLPANWAGKNAGAERHAMHGLILDSKTDDIKTQSNGDGQSVTGVIHAGNFGGHWLSQTDLNFKIDLEKDGVTATITAKNVGNEPEPIGIGWHPYFSIPSGDRTQARLHIPATEMAVVNNYDDVFPTGKLKPVKGTEYDYTAPGGKALDDHFLDDNFSHIIHLTAGSNSGAADVQLIDPKTSYGIHILGESPEIKTIQVYAPKDKAFTAIEEQFNFGDPFGKEWHGMDTGMVTLKPGASVTWKVKLELFTPAK